MRFSADPRVVLRDPVHFLAFGFGSGLSPKAPGTMGTVIAVPIAAALMQLSVPAYLCSVLMLSVFGIWLCGQSAARLGIKDHPGIVWDEIAGYCITMTALPFTWWSLVAGFVVFRVFDIAKPWPISEADHRLSGGLGIMLDDIIAGIFAAAILYVMQLFLR